MSVAVLILAAVAALVILTGVVLVVMGRGGELARFEADYPPVDLPTERPVTGTDVGHVRLPLALWGYHVRAVDEALHRVAAALTERDRRIAVLEDTVVNLGGVSALRTAHEAGGGWRPEPRRSHPMALDGVEEPHPADDRRDPHDPEHSEYPEHAGVASLAALADNSATSDASGSADTESHWPEAGEPPTAEPGTEPRSERHTEP